MKTVICRYCAEMFTPLAGKPGYIDECPACLHERTAPQRAEPFSADSARRRKLRNEAHRALAALGAPDDDIARFLDSLASPPS
jgi:hypothetical protein